jgi:CubicO group peptidase (beta-lactamase class C family)
MQLWSSTKWVSAVAIMKEYERGAIELDAPVSKYLDYWTTDPTDSRSNITLRHILGFSDGFNEGLMLSDAKLGAYIALGCDLQSCARKFYNNIKHKAAPGSFIEYNEYHLTLAGAAVEVATGQTMYDIIERNVFKPVGMTNITHLTKVLHFQDLGSGLVATSRDYSKFVAALFRNELINETTRSQMFTNAWPNAQRRGEFRELHTRYGLATWYECPHMFWPKPWDWSAKCAAARIFACAGAGGTYPLIDLNNKYWLYLHYDGGAGLGFAISGLFRDILKPLVDAAVTGRAMSNASVEVPRERIACLEEAKKIGWANRTDGMVVAAKLRC